ncbi:Phosphoribosylformylglycinamidine synthase subunit PurS [archaeon HR06]|nr:Phosphoribosylformylglycinamidine synthase subunit PurS [archaeon HR06]
MPEYKVEVLIENKPKLRDPEGETVYRELILKGGYNMVKEVRTGKMLRIVLEAGSKLEAEELVKKLCDELRIYNPLVSTLRVKVIE